MWTRLFDILLSSRQSPQTVCTFVWPWGEPQSTGFLLLGNQLFPTMVRWYFLLCCGTTPCCSSSPCSKGFFFKKGIWFSVRKLRFRPTFYFWPWTKHLTSLSLRLLTCLLASRFLTETTLVKSYFSILHIWLLNLKKRKLSKLRSDISGALFSICAFLQRSWVVAWFICCYFTIKSCLTLCNPMDCSLPGSFIYEISQARVLEWASVSLSRGSPSPGVTAKSPALAGESSTAELPGKPSLLHATIY